MAEKRFRRLKGDGMIRQRVDGSWEGRVPIGNDPESGKTKYKSVYGKTMNAVRSKMKVVLDNAPELSMPNGKYIKVNEPSDEERAIKFGDWLDIWLTQYKVNSLTPTTYESYRVIIEHHLKPALGKVLIAEITTDQIQHLLNRKQKVGERKDGRHDTSLAASYIIKMKIVINASLKQAVRNKLIPYNPTEGVITPKMRRKEIRVLTPEEQDKFMNTLKGHRLEALFKLALATGMRKGELIALTWDCVNFEKKTINITKTADRVRDKVTRRTSIQVGGPKSESGYREIPMLPSVVPVLEQHYLRQQREQREAGSAYNKQNLVFCSTVGGYIEPRRINTTLDKLINSAGIGHINFHALRHTFATRALESSIPAKVVQAMLGHADVALTLNTYTHLLKETLHEEMNKMDDIFLTGASGRYAKKEPDRER